MTTEELIKEWDYRYQERIGILCGTAEPTTAQGDIAVKEADEAIEKLKQPLDKSNQ